MMVNHVKLNLEEIEAMLYFWHATAEREKVAEAFLHQVADMPGLSMAYDQEFNRESVRRVLSAITNRERLSNMTKKEARFWSNNMWMLEDLGYIDSIVIPLKRMNLDDLPPAINEKVPSIPFTELEVIITPLHYDEFFISSNHLVINFFKIIPADGDIMIQGVPLKAFMLNQLVAIG